MKRFSCLVAVLLVLLVLPGQVWAAAKIDLAFDGVLVPTERTEEAVSEYAYSLPNLVYELFRGWFNLPSLQYLDYNSSNYKPMALLVEGVNLNYLACYSRLGMSRSLDCYFENDAVANIYNTLQSGLLREVEEPKTPYGALFEVQDYYVEQFVLGFSEEKPQPKAYLEDRADKADFMFRFYEMLEGQPEFGEDSKCLVYVERTDKWYVLDPQAFAEAAAFKAYLSDFAFETLLSEQA